MPLTNESKSADSNHNSSKNSSFWDYFKWGVGDSDKENKCTSYHDEEDDFSISRATPITAATIGDSDPKNTLDTEVRALNENIDTDNNHPIKTGFIASLSDLIDEQQTDRSQELNDNISSQSRVNVTKNDDILCHAYHIIDGLDLVHLDIYSKILETSLLGESGIIRTNCPEKSDVKLSLSGLLLNTRSALALRNKAFNQLPSYYDIFLDNNFRLSGKFLLSEYRISHCAKELTVCHITLKSDGKILSDNFTDLEKEIKKFNLSSDIVYRLSNFQHSCMILFSE